MLVGRDLEAPARHFPLNYPHARVLSLWLNPSSHVTWVADGHRGQSGLPDRVRQHQVNFLRYLLVQRRPLRGPMLVADHVWMTLDRTFLMLFISLEGKDGLQFRKGGYVPDKKADLHLYVSCFFFCDALLCIL